MGSRGPRWMKTGRHYSMGKRKKKKGERKRKRSAAITQGEENVRPKTIHQSRANPFRRETVFSEKKRKISSSEKRRKEKEVNCVVEAGTSLYLLRKEGKTSAQEREE